MNIDPMDTPKTRSEFEHRFHILLDAMRNGKIHFAQGISTESLMKVRKLPNGRLDCLSVDEQARLTANMMCWMSDVEFPAE